MIYAIIELEFMDFDIIHLSGLQALGFGPIKSLFKRLVKSKELKVWIIQDTSNNGKISV